MSATISVNIITKDQAKPTARALASLSSLLRAGDEVVVVDTGSTDKSLRRLRKLLPLSLPDNVDLKVLSHPELSSLLTPLVEKWLPEHVGTLQQHEQYANARGLLNFAAARNVALDASTKDVIFWLDSDDVLVEETPGKLREVIDKTLAPDTPVYSALFMSYEYSYNDDGTPGTVLKRERAMRRGDWRWKGRCHETMIPEDKVSLPVGFGADLYSFIRHTEARKVGVYCDIRNYIVLRNELEETKQIWTDPRTLFYMGNSARGVGRLREAMEHYKRFLPLSGSPDDRYATCSYLADMYMNPSIQRPLEAAKWYRKAMEIRPKDPRAYFGLSRTYAAQFKWSECIDWFNIARGFPEPDDTLHTYDASSVHYVPYLIASKAYLELEQPDEAVKCAHAARKFRPDATDINETVHVVEQLAAGHHLTNMLLDVGRHVKGGGNRAREMLQKVLPYLHAVPEQLEKVGIGLVSTDPREERPALAIYCGETPEAWGPESSKSGIGGSEKMVILLAPLLQAAGWNVSIYGNIPFNQRGVYPDGVRWEHWSAFDRTQPLNVLVAWRQHAYTLIPVSTDLRVLWLHDIQSPDQYTPEVLATVDLVIAESEYHAAPIRGVVHPDNLVVLRNAVQLPDIDLLAKKDPKRVIFLSSPDRGLGTALKMVAAAQKEDPEIKVTVLYGFSPYARKSRLVQDHRFIPDLGHDASLDDYEIQIGELLDATNADHGHRVSFDKVWEHLQQAGVWLYPTQFAEISCMSAMEAQVAGCVCLTSEFAALAETVLPEAKALGENLGPVEDGDEYIQRGARALLAAVQVPADDPRRIVQAVAAREAFDVVKLAQQWTDLFTAGESDSGGLKDSVSGSVRPTRSLQCKEST